MPHLLQARTSRRSGPRKGNKHAGIYGKQKDICPTPRTVHLNINIPVGYANALMEMYPDLTLYKAIQTYIVTTLKLIESKDVDTIS